MKETEVSYKTIPEVFIIESLTFEDEMLDRFEGKILSNILEMHGKEPIYFYIRTKQEFEEVLEKFLDSQYRYLHISCHGTTNSMETTLDSIHFDEFSEIINPTVRYKRLFLSACSMVNEKLVKRIIPGNKCHSIIGPDETVKFRDSAIFWASFYHLMFSNDFESMKQNEITQVLGNLTTIFDVPISYYSVANQNKQGYSYRKVNIRNR